MVNDAALSGLQSSHEFCDVAVVGLGAMGAATVYQLAKRGVKVVGIDRFSPPHDQGSSHGDTRITRQAVGEGAAYVPLVANSHRIWRELESETGLSLFEQCGVLIMRSSAVPAVHHGAADFTQSTIQLARTYGIDHEELNGHEIRQRFPHFAPVPDNALGYFEPGGGYVRPERCIEAQLTMAKRLGAVLITDKTVTGVGSERGKAVVSTDGNPIFADRVIVCAGMWSATLLGAPFDSLLKVYRQTLYWFKLEEPSIFPDPCPSFILCHGPTAEDICYGFPPIAGENSMKVATEQFTVATTPDRLNRQVSDAETDAIFRDHVAGKIDGVSTEPVKSRVCFYTVTPDFGFIIDRHPDLEEVTVVSACSGHGFKHSAAIGEALAQQYVTGSSEVDLAAFSLQRFKDDRQQ